MVVNNIHTTPLAKSEELSNAFLDYYNKWFIFALKYNPALFEAPYKGLETFLKARDAPPAKKPCANLSVTSKTCAKIPTIDHIGNNPVKKWQQKIL